jgi:hypothetical protein
VTRSRHRKQGRGRWLVAGAAALAVLVLVVAMAWADRGGGRDDDRAGSAADGAGDPAASVATPEADATGPSPATDDPTGGASAGEPAVTLEAGVTEAARLDAVPLSGTYRPGATLRVQVADDGTWSSYPLGIVVDDDGRFSTYVELGRTGRVRVRMVEPSTGVTSNEVEVTVS